MTSASLPLIAANYKLRRFSITPTSAEWTLVCPANPSRWHILFFQDILGDFVISQWPGDALGYGIRIGAPPNFLEINFRDSPQLCCGEWWASAPNFAPPRQLTAVETTLAGT